MGIRILIKMENKSEDHKAGYIEGMRRILNDIPKKSWNFRKILAFFFRDFDEYIEGLNDGFADGYLKRHGTTIEGKYIKDDEKEKMKLAIKNEMQRQELQEKFDKKEKNINKFNNMNSLEYQIELLEDLKDSLFKLQESLAKIPKVYESKIEAANDAELFEEYVNDFNDRFLPETSGMLDSLAQKIESEDIAIIDLIIADIEGLIDVR